MSGEGVRVQHQPALIECEVIEPPGEPLDGFVIVASWRGEHWRVFWTIYSTADTASDAARQLAKGWRHRTVLRLRVPT